MANRWGNNENSDRLYFLGLQITADGDCSHEIKRPLLFGRKAMTNLDSILKSRDITLLTKVHLIKVMVFPIVMYGCESWTIKKAEHQRIDAFELWCWRRLLRIPWTARRSNQSILKEISVEYSLEGLILKLKVQYFGHLMWRTDSLEKTLRLKAGEVDDRGWDGWMASPTQWVWESSRSWWWTGKPGKVQSMGLQRVGHDWATEPELKNSEIRDVQTTWNQIVWFIQQPQSELNVTDNSVLRSFTYRTVFSYYTSVLSNFFSKISDF